jgi:transposase-like protein
MIMAKPQRPPICKWRHFAPDVILGAVGWYLRYSHSYRELQELEVERGLRLDHTTIRRLILERRHHEAMPKPSETQHAIAMVST